MPNFTQRLPYATWPAPAMIASRAASMAGIESAKPRTRSTDTSGSAPPATASVGTRIAAAVEGSRRRP